MVRCEAWVSAEGCFPWPFSLHCARGTGFQDGDEHPSVERVFSLLGSFQIATPPSHVLCLSGSGAAQSRE